MLPTPNKFFLTTGKGEGGTELNAFDAALLDAGLGNQNLLKVSSILPPGAIEIPVTKIPPGSLVPVAYGAVTSNQPGELISAAVGVGISGDTYGVIMEFHGYCPQNEAAEIVADMVREGFRVRGLPLQDLKVAAIDHRVGSAGSVFAAVVLGY